MAAAVTYATVRQMYFGKTYAVGADISHFPEKLLAVLVERGDASPTKPKE